MHTGPIPAVVTTDVMLTLVVEGDYGIPVPASFHYSAHEPLSPAVNSRSSGSSRATCCKEGSTGPSGRAM